MDIEIGLSYKYKYMDLGDKKFGVYDPATKMFYTVPAASQEEFAKFMRSLGLAVCQKEAE